MVHRGSVVAALALAAFACGAAAEEMTPEVSEPMLDAGAEALSVGLGEGSASSDRLRTMAQETFAAMYPHQWLPIESAPLDRVILLGHFRGNGFEVALGTWEVTDDWPYDGGRWSVTYLWQDEPTHWLPVPPGPR